MYTVGIDSGSVATKAVLFNGKIIEKIIMPTGWSPKTTAFSVLEALIEKASIKREEIKKIIGTGYGRISMPFADKTFTEITCHGKGAHYLNNRIRTILDIGGQDSKVIGLDDQGNVTDFMMNDKCAAGTGRFLQVMANVLGVEVEDFDRLSSGFPPEPITSMCTVFAESEVISLLAKGIEKERLASGIIHSIANRGVSMLHKIKIHDTVAFTGGVAKSKVIRSVIEQKIQKPLFSPPDAQFAGALGAAVIGWHMLSK